MAWSGPRPGPGPKGGDPVNGMEASMARPVRIRVKLFAVAAERAGAREGELVFEGGDDGTVTVGVIRAQLPVRFPGLASLMDVCALAVNAQYAEDGEAVSDGAEVAVIPPVSGGDEAEVQAEAFAQIVPGVLDPARLTAAVGHAGAGAIVIFLGTVRDHADGHVTEALTYEAYEDLANREMARIVTEIAARSPGVRLAAQHRTGNLAVGETAVVVAASAPHRGEAFEACREAIDRIKREVPIWKQEVGPDGRRWTEGTPVAH